jgi:hypothetical protein
VSTEATDDLLQRLREEREAAVANGDDCYQCGRMVSVWGGGKGYRRLCHECESLISDPGEVSHSSRIRCPACGHVEEVYEKEDGRIYDEDGHDVYCSECDTEYRIRTMVSYTFTSPKRNS